jgi:hypothetical protein
MEAFRLLTECAVNYFVVAFGFRHDGRCGGDASELTYPTWRSDCLISDLYEGRVTAPLLGHPHKYLIDALLDPSVVAVQLRQWNDVTALGSGTGFDASELRGAGRASAHSRKGARRSTQGRYRFQSAGRLAK